MECVRASRYQFSKAQGVLAFLDCAHREFTFDAEVVVKTTRRPRPPITMSVSVDMDSLGQKLITLSPSLIITNLVPLPITLRTCVVLRTGGDSGNRGRSATSASTRSDAPGGGGRAAGRGAGGVGPADAAVADIAAAAAAAGVGDDAWSNGGQQSSASEPRVLQPTQTVKLHDVQRAVGLAIQVSLSMGAGLRPGVWSQPALLMAEPALKKKAAGNNKRKNEATVAAARAADFGCVEYYTACIHTHQGLAHTRAYARTRSRRHTLVVRARRLFY